MLVENWNYPNVDANNFFLSVQSVESTLFVDDVELSLKRL